MGLEDVLSDAIENLWEAAIQQHPESQEHKRDLIATISRMDRIRWIRDNLKPGQAHPGLGAFWSMANRRWAFRSCGRDFMDTREEPITSEEAMAGVLNEDEESDDE